MNPQPQSPEIEPNPGTEPSPKRDPSEVAKEISAELQAALAEPEQSAPPAPGEPPAAPAVNEEAVKLKDQLLRTMAEMENLRKRSERDQTEARKYAVTGFARDMVNVAENLKMALDSIPEQDRAQDGKLAKLAEGVELTYSELLRIFSSHGITRLEPTGEKFDHNRHQAVAQVEDPKAVPGTVSQVLQAGYMIQDRLLRPAMVTVAKGGGEAPQLDTEA